MFNSARAQFAPDPRRRALIGKVKVGKKQLGMDDDTYRGVLFAVAGKTSAADLSEPELVRVVEHMKARGFKPMPGKPKGGAFRSKARAADTPIARKARAMWISLYHLGAIKNPSEAALEAFACRQLKVEKMQWADAQRGYKLVEALKAMAEREGWSQDMHGLKAEHHVHGLKVSLVEAILKKMKAAQMIPADWSAKEAAFRLCGIERGKAVFATSELEQIAESLGQKMREMSA